MGDKAYVVVEGMTDVAVVRAVLPPGLLGEVTLAAAGDRSSVMSVARTILVTRRKPVAVLVDTDSVDEWIVQDRMQSTQELLRAVAGGIQTKVILLIPTIEASFFEAGDLITRLLGAPPTEELRWMARNNPKEALERLFSQSSGPKNIGQLLDRLDDAGMAALRATRPIQELITFLEGVVKLQPKHSVM